MSYRSIAIRIASGMIVLAFAVTSMAAPLELKNRKPEPGQSGQSGQSTPQPEQPSQPGAPAQPSGPSGTPGQGIQPPQSGQSGTPDSGPSSPTFIVPVAPAPSDPQSPTIIVPVPVPVGPESQSEPAPEKQPDVVIVPVEPVKEQPKAPEQAKPEEAPTGPLTPGSFLPKTEETKPETRPAQPEKKEPVKKPEKKAEPKKEPEKKQPKQPEKQPEKKNEHPKKGEPLRIPEEAKETGALDFLEGCWVGTRPEYHSKRIVTERFCFGKDGVGKRFILDPGVAGQCVGATRAILNKGGVLRMESDRMYCTDVDDNWGASQMTCQGEGDQTPCTWVFHDVGGAKQSYTIRFVRE